MIFYCRLDTFVCSCQINAVTMWDFVKNRHMKQVSLQHGRLRKLSNLTEILEQGQRLNHANHTRFFSLGFYCFEEQELVYEAKVLQLSGVYSVQHQLSLIESPWSWVSTIAQTFSILTAFKNKILAGHGVFSPTHHLSLSLPPLCEREKKWKMYL